MSAVVEATAPTSTAQVLDVDALLAPIPGDNPAGESLQYAGVFDEIREARRAEDDLSQGEWQHEPKTADWPKVIELSSAVLATKSKDLQVGGWLVEALVELHGFVGLRDGLKLIRGLHEQFWDKLYPEIEEGDMDGRANAVALMDARVELPLKKVSLTKSGAGADYSYIQWEESSKFDIPENIEGLDSESQSRALELKEQAIAEGKTTGDAWRKAKNATRRSFYEQTFTLLNESWAEFQALDKVMDEKFGRQTPGMGAVKGALELVRTLVEKVVKEKRILEPDPVDGHSSGGEMGSDSGASLSADGGPLRGRTEALRQLAEVAQYFQRTEPHSPVAYLVQRAIKWGQMPLEVWLEDVIKDDAVLGHLKETLGLDSPLGADKNS